MKDHLNDIELELARTGEAESSVMAHAGSCHLCAEQIVLLEGLAAGLHGSATVEIPAETDLAITALAHERAAEIRRRVIAVKPVRRWVMPAAAAAAALIVAAAGLLTLQLDPPVGSSTMVEADVNGDGTTDILDALALANDVERGGASPVWDLDGDGTINAIDIRRVALAAVSLEHDV